MQSTVSLATYRYRPSLRSRATALGLSLGICALIVIMLIKMGALGPLVAKPNAPLVAINLSHPPETANAVKAHTVAKSAPKATDPKPIPPVPQPQPRTVTPVPPVFINLSKEEFAAADIGKMPKRASGGSQSNGSGTAYGPGEGPGGSKLYNAEWYREPSDAEMATYMPRRDVSGGWAVIACKTEERYHVTDCRELGESPPGSGLSRALRQAAWQFLVRPPRIDGKPVIGAWVRIRFDFRAAKASTQPDSAPD